MNSVSHWVFHSFYKTVLALGSALYQLIDVDLIDELGEVTTASANVMRDADTLMAAAPTNNASSGMVTA